MYRWWELKKQNKVYQTEEPPEDSYDVDLIIDGLKIKLPEKKTEDPKKYLDVISNYLLGFDYDFEEEDDDEDDDDEKEKEEDDNQKKLLIILIKEQYNDIYHLLVYHVFSAAAAAAFSF